MTLLNWGQALHVDKTSFPMPSHKSFAAPCIIETFAAIFWMRDYTLSYKLSAYNNPYRMWNTSIKVFGEFYNIKDLIYGGS